MRTELLIACALLLVAAPVSADDRPAPLTSGVIKVKFQAVQNPDAMPTVSISLSRVDTGLVVFCKGLDELGIASGLTDLIANDAPQVLLVGFAWSGFVCTGVVSLPSADRYLVTFSAPAPPIMIFEENLIE